MQLDSLIHSLNHIPNHFITHRFAFLLNEGTLYVSSTCSYAYCCGKVWETGGPFFTSLCIFVSLKTSENFKSQL